MMDVGCGSGIDGDDGSGDLQLVQFHVAPDLLFCIFWFSFRVVGREGGRMTRGREEGRKEGRVRMQERTG